MIRIQKSSEVEKAFFKPRTMAGAETFVRAVIEDVRHRDDEALHYYAAKFDAANPAAFEIPSDTLKACAEKMQKEKSALYDALCRSRDLVMKFANRQRKSFDDFEIEIDSGLFTGQKNIPVERAGVYVPAGRFPLVSTVIMTVIPALAAGVSEVILCTPPRAAPNRAKDGGDPYADENIMAAAYLCGAHRVFAVGGAQAIAAMAYSTQSIPRCDVIVGPGNKFVAEAKRQVYGTVGIDMIAGPTEVFIIADKTANPAWVAADLLAQAEHDVIAQSTLATDDPSLADAVAKEMEKQLAALPTRSIADASVNDCGRIIITKSLAEAAEIANRKAPEHLEIAMNAGAARDEVAALLHNYGSLFIGHEAAEVLGDYAAGLNHTLPTSGSAHYTGGLSVRMFIKTVTTLRAKRGSSGLEKSAAAANQLGEAEGLAGHAKSAALRMGL